MKPISLAIIIPCFNEEDVIVSTLTILLEELNKLEKDHYINKDSKILVVDDGSTDTSWEKIRTLSNKYKNIMGIKLSKNFGHQNAQLAGMMYAKNSFDAVITIDADLQDDVTKMWEMLELHRKGYMIVYGVRSDRKTDSFFKKTSASIYYKTLKALGVEIIQNHGDYRLVSSKVLHKLELYGERNLFLRGLFPSLGFKSACVYYHRKSRKAGETKYSISKMISLGLKGITSFSIRPLRLLTTVGFIVFSTSLILGLWALYIYVEKKTVLGWASTVVPLYFLGGIQILSMGIIGEYIGKIYIEVKGRPTYIIEEVSETHKLN